MSGTGIFRRRELQCHKSVNVVNDRSSYTARRVSELDVLSAIGSVVNACGGRGVARFEQCEVTRGTWLRAIQRALLERHLSRLLHFYPSLEDTCKHFRSDASETRIGDGLDPYNALVHFTVFALMCQGVSDCQELRDAAMRPERLMRLLYCARQKALPMLMSWFLAEHDGDEASFQQLMLHYGMQHKELDGLRLSVRQELEATRVFVTEFLLALEKQSPQAMATHIPETFICDGGSETGGVLSFEDDLDELRKAFVPCSKTISWSTTVDILDPSLRCRTYNDSKDEDNPPKYQWLPTEFQVGVDGVVEVLSPLHGSVHPNGFPGLYAAVPKLLERLVPLFEHSLGSIATEDPPQPHQIGLGSTWQVTEKHSKENLKHPGQPLSGGRFELRGRRLQVVVKLSTVRLDEDHQVFSGDQDHADSNRGWNLDGDDHEQIVSVGYHVIRSRNITPPKLAFRAFAHCPSSQEPDLSSQENTFLAFGERTSASYKGRYGRQFLQPWGSLVLHEHRSIVAPSFFAHRMEPFELLDRTNPNGGELTMATFYLVDPTIKPIVSTSTVRPEEWQQTRRFVQANVDLLRHSFLHPFLPDEVARQIADFAASRTSESQTQLTREQLLSHRQKLQALRFMTPSQRLEEMNLDLVHVMREETCNSEVRYNSYSF